MFLINITKRSQHNTKQKANSMYRGYENQNIKRMLTLRYMKTIKCMIIITIKYNNDYDTGKI